MSEISWVKIEPEPSTSKIDNAALLRNIDKTNSQMVEDFFNKSTATAANSTAICNDVFDYVSSASNTYPEPTQWGVPQQQQNEQTYYYGGPTRTPEDNRRLYQFINNNGTQPKYNYDPYQTQYQQPVQNQQYSQYSQYQQPQYNGYANNQLYNNLYGCNNQYNGYNPQQNQYGYNTGYQNQYNMPQQQQTAQPVTYGYGWANMVANNSNVYSQYTGYGLPQQQYVYNTPNQYGYNNPAHDNYSSYDYYIAKNMADPFNVNNYSYGNDYNYINNGYNPYPQYQQNNAYVNNGGYPGIYDPSYGVATPGWRQ